MLERLFHLADNRTTVRTELVAGVTMMMPLTVSITDGMAFGFIAYAVVKPARAAGARRTRSFMCVRVVNRSSLVVAESLVPIANPRIPIVNPEFRMSADDLGLAIWDRDQGFRIRMGTRDSGLAMRD